MSTLTRDSAKKSSNNLNRQAGAYALAAAVAGVSVLALAAPAVGEVVITKKTIHIPLAPRDMQEPVTISMANNGVNNFSFILSSSTGYPTKHLRELTVVSVDPGKGGAQNQFIAGGSFYTKALALSRGAEIGPATPTSAFFDSSEGLVEGTNASHGSYYSRGYWGGNPTNKYLGVRFQLKGQTHYGWIRITVTVNTKSKKPSLEATITGYAYESVANKPIKAGMTATASADARIPKVRNRASLGMLAAGADGLSMWRREESSVRQ